MRTFKAILPVLVVVSALAASAAPASAAPVEVTDRATGSHCNLLGACELHATGNISSVYHSIIGDFEYRCAWEVTFHIGNEDGAFTVMNPNFANYAGGTGNCTSIAPCETPWGQGTISHTGGIEYMNVVVCVTGSFATCEGNLTLVLARSGINYSAVMNDTPISGTWCEGTGTLTPENPSQIIVTHL